MEKVSSSDNNEQKDIKIKVDNDIEGEINLDVYEEIAESRKLLSSVKERREKRKIKYANSSNLAGSSNFNLATCWIYDGQSEIPLPGITLRIYEDLRQIYLVRVEENDPTRLVRVVYIHGIDTIGFCSISGQFTLKFGVETEHFFITFAEQIQRNIVSDWILSWKNNQ